MSFGLTRTLGAAVALTGIVALATAAIVFLSLDALGVAADQRNTGRSCSAISMLPHAMLDQETGFRGYLITGNDDNLEPYRRGVDDLPT